MSDNFTAFDEKVESFDLRDLLSRPAAMPTEALLESCSNFEQHQAKPPTFFGAKPPAYIMQEEKAQHRVIIYLAAEGNTITEISQITGFTTATIGYVLKQPWAQEQIQTIIAEKGGDKVELVLKGAALAAAEHLVNTISNAQAPAAVRAKCANDVLDRIYGKAQQVILHGKADPSDLTDEDLAKHIPKTSGSGTTQ